MVLAADRERLRARGARHRRGAVDPGPARAAGRHAGGGRRSARPVRRRDARTSSPTSTCGATSREQQKDAVVERVPPDVQARVPALPAGPRVAGPVRPAAAGRRAGWASRVERRTPDAPDADGVHRVAARRAAVAHRPARGRDRREYLGARGAQVRDLPRLGAVQEAAALGDGRRAGRDLAAVGADQRADRARSGSSRSPSTWSSARTASRTGRRTAAGDGVREGARCTASRSSRRARSATAGSTRSSRASCSSGTRWSRATGGRTTGSSTTTARCSPRSRSWSTGPGGATSSSTTRRCSTFYDAAGPGGRRLRRGTSTRGGRRRGARRRTC